MPIQDRRGRYGHKNKISEDKSRLVIKHIKSIPTMTSHYSRASSPNVKYLAIEVRSVTQMYDLYKDWLLFDDELTEELRIPVTKHYYEDMIKSQFQHLKIYQPRSDTCKTCDKFRSDLHHTNNLSEAEKKNIETLREIHHLKAEQGASMPKTLYDKCKSLYEK